MAAVADVFPLVAFFGKIVSHKGNGPIFVAYGVLGSGALYLFLGLDKTCIMKKCSDQAKVNMPFGENLSLDMKTMKEPCRSKGA